MDKAAREELLAKLVAIVGDGSIPRFDEALTHPSYANELGVADNQRLEFLGDAVLGLCESLQEGTYGLVEARQLGALGRIVRKMA